VHVDDHRLANRNDFSFNSLPCPYPAADGNNWLSLEKSADATQRDQKVPCASLRCVKLFVSYTLREKKHASPQGPGGCLIKLDIINEVVNRTGITKTKAEMAVETVFDTMKKALSEGDRIELRGFGIFNVRPRKTGIGRNPRTGAEVAIPPGKAVRFKPGKELQALQ
jgi:DNA-binding protein HU-beta